MVRTALTIAGFALSAVLVLAASCEAAPDCRTSPGNPGCPSPRAVKSINPPKPEPVPRPAAKPQPKAEPRILQAESHPQPAPKRVTQKPQHKHQLARATRRSPQRSGMAQNSRAYRYDSQPALRSHWPHDRDSRPPSGPVYEAGAGYGCDEACRYRAWFQEYNAWYQAYGRRYAEYPNSSGAAGTPPSAGDNGARPPNMPRRDEARIRGERDRLDPWHGYDGHDGPQNGY